MPYDYVFCLDEVIAENYDGGNSGSVPSNLKGISPVPIIENGTLIHEVAAVSIDMADAHSGPLINAWVGCVTACFGVIHFRVSGLKSVIRLLDAFTTGTH